MGGEYLDSEEYSKALTATLNGFFEALTHRWREEALDALTSNSPAVPCGSEPLRWQFPAEAYGHLSGGSGEFCTYLKWVVDGQHGSFKGATCEGWNPLTQEYVECHADRVLEQVEDWAWDKRQEVASALPQLEGLDLSSLEEAYNAFVRIGGGLSLVNDQGGEDTLPALGGRPLVDDVEWLSGHDSEKEWFAGWTGLAASTVKDGFLASAKPTLRNQSILLGWLANLYSDRAAMIQTTRNNVLEWLKWATKTLNEKQVVAVDLTTGLTVLSGVGATMGVVGLFSTAAAAATGPIGAVVGLVGFLGQELAKSTVERSAMSLSDALGKLDTEVRNLHSKLDELETGYFLAVTTLQRELAGVHSYNLELYDLTQNNPRGDETDPSAGAGHSANVSFILDVAQRCYEASEAYSERLRDIAPTAQADRQLAGRDGVQMEGDTTVLELRDTLESFIKTTCARYLLGGDQIKAAAKKYAKTDDEQARLFRSKIDAWKEEGIGRYDKTDEHGNRRDKDVDLDPSTKEKESDPSGPAAGTDRDDIEPEAPGEPRGGGYEEKRDADGEDYRTETDRPGR